MFRRRDGTPVEGGDPACEDIDKVVQFRVGKCAVDISVSGCSVAVEVIRADNDLERAAAANQVRESFRTSAAGVQSHPDFGMTQLHVLARSETHVASEDELAAHAPDAAARMARDGQE